MLAVVGDQSLFTRSTGIDRLWEISTSLLENRPRSSRTPADHGDQNR
ncbi:MAG: hypothetical protein J2P57_16840 [Acidimicrobiaceae bacterium]|nr:hypothetical protein [Acidimicrobiaceae bacterium]